MPKKIGNYLVITSPKIHKPSKDVATPRTADETMWVTGEVTLIERREERHIKKPRVPFFYNLSIQELEGKQRHVR